MTKKNKRSLVNEVIADKAGHAAVAKISMNCHCIGGRSLGRNARRALDRKLTAVFRSARSKALTELQ